MFVNRVDIYKCDNWVLFTILYDFNLVNIYIWISEALTLCLCMNIYTFIFISHNYLKLSDLYKHAWFLIGFYGCLVGVLLLKRPIFRVFTYINLLILSILYKFLRILIEYVNFIGIYIYKSKSEFYEENLSFFADLYS